MNLVPTAWSLWVAGALMAGALEVHLSNFVMLWLAVGALVSAALARLGAPLELQLGAFTLTAAALYGLSRTLFRSVLMRGGHPLKTGVDAMIGQEAVVVESLEPPEDPQGTVRIHGELWSARSLEGSMPPGARVRVEHIEGLRLHVRRLSSPHWTTGLRRKETP